MIESATKVIGLVGDRDALRLAGRARGVDDPGEVDRDGPAQARLARRHRPGRHEHVHIAGGPLGRPRAVLTRLSSQISARAQESSST